MVHVPQIRPNNQRNGSGWWPDPLVPVQQAIGVAGEATPLWFTVHAPPHTSHDRREYHATITLSGTDSKFPSLKAETITIPVYITVFGFSLPPTPPLMTAFNLDESKIGDVYYPNASREVPLADIKFMWDHTGCSNSFSHTLGEQSWWQNLPDGGAQDMYDYCAVTRAGTASPAQLAVSAVEEISRDD